MDQVFVWVIVAHFTVMGYGGDGLPEGARYRRVFAIRGRMPCAHSIGSPIAGGAADLAGSHHLSKTGAEEMSIAALVVAGPLKMGPLKLQSVFALQIALVKCGYAIGSPDGYFGPLTQAAVVHVQQAGSLPQTGIVNDATARVIDCLVAIAPPVPGVSLPGDPDWLKIATSLLGIYEALGNADNPTILGWARELGGMIAREYKHDSIPWCMLFVQYCLYKSGQPHLDSLWALDNADYGVRLAGPARGAIGTKTRNGGGHTFFIAGRSAGGMLVIRGGNQSDMVCDEEIDASQLHSVTWPEGQPLPPAIGFSHLPIVKDAPRDRREA